MEKEQIIKALECCSGSDCRRCPYFGHITCISLMRKDSIALIKELTQANEQLSESYDHLEKTKDELLSERARLIEANQKLQTMLVTEHYQTELRTAQRIFNEIYSSLDYIEEQMEPEEIPECFFSVREDIDALKEKFESEGRGG